MFGVITQSASRRALPASVRCMSQGPRHPKKKQNNNGSNSRPVPAQTRPEQTQSSNSAQEAQAHVPPPLVKPTEPFSLETGKPVSRPTESAPEPPIETAPTQVPTTVVSLDFSPVEAGGERERTGAKSSKDSLSTSEKRRRVMGRITMGILALAFGANVVYMGREWDADELESKKLKIEDAPSTRWGRTRDRFTELFDYFNKPSWPELLPPPLPPHLQKPLTLLISIDDLLVTSTWDRQHGWRTAKRPGVDYFLAYISQFYEVVIFTTQNHYTAMPILEKLDRYNFFINYRLFRDATRSINGKIVKDLSYLNRDLSKVIMLDTDPEHVSTHPENAIILPKWKGDPKDRGLIAMIPFLESIGIYKPADVRPILEAYKDKDIPLEYARKEAEAKQKYIEDWKKSSKGLASGGFTFSSLFGGTGAPAAPPIPLTYLEQKRKEAQMQYKEEHAYIAAHKNEFEKLLEQDQLAMAAEVPGSLWEAIDQLKGVPPKKKDDASGASASTTTSTATTPSQPQAGTA